MTAVTLAVRPRESPGEREIQRGWVLGRRERIRGQIHPTRPDAGVDVFSHTEMFYNTQRRQKSSGGVSTVEFKNANPYGSEVPIHPGRPLTNTDI